MSLSRTDLPFLPDELFAHLSQYAWFRHISGPDELAAQVVRDAPSGMAKRCIPYLQGHLDQMDQMGNLAIVEAVRRPILLPALMAAGADLNAVQHDGHNALRTACRENPAAAQFLVVHGADVQAAHPNDRVSNWAGWTPLMVAAAHRPILISLLLASGAHLNVRNAQRRTALMVAAEHPSPEGFRMLLEAGAADERLFRRLGKEPASFKPAIHQIWHGFCVKTSLQHLLPEGTADKAARPRF